MCNNLPYWLIYYIVRTTCLIGLTLKFDKKGKELVCNYLIQCNADMWICIWIKYIPAVEFYPANINFLAYKAFLQAVNIVLMFYV